MDAVLFLLPKFRAPDPLRPVAASSISTMKKYFPPACKMPAGAGNLFHFTL